MLVENKTTEFKREYVDDIKKTIVAFANSDGGTLYIGVNDDGTPMLSGMRYALTLLCLWNVVMMLLMAKQLSV